MMYAKTTGMHCPSAPSISMVAKVPSPIIVLLTVVDDEPEALAAEVAAALRAHPAGPTHLEGVIDQLRSIAADTLCVINQKTSTGAL